MSSCFSRFVSLQLQHFSLAHNCETQVPNESKVPWPSALIIAASNFVPSMMVATLGIALPDVRRSLLMSELAGGALFSVIFTIAVASSAFAGRLGDRIGSKTVLIAGLSILASGFMFAGTSSHQTMMLLFLGITGLGYGFIPTSLYTLMSDIAPRRRGLVSSLVAVAYGLGGFAGSLLASRLIAFSGWREAFIVVGTVAMTIMVLELWMAPRHHPIRSAGPSMHLKKAFPSSLIILALAEFLGGSVFWSTASWAPTLLRSAKALSLSETGWVMGLWSLSQIFGALMLGDLSDKFGRKLVIVASAFPAAVVSFIAYAWLTSPAGLALGFILAGALRASAPTLVVALAQETTSQENVGTATGIVMSMHYATAVVTPLVAARLITGTNDIILAMILVTAIPIVVYGCLIGAVRERRQTTHA